MRRGEGLRLAYAFALTASACGGGTASPGLCSAGVAPGQACNALVDMADPITPTCLRDVATPVGTGGTIVDGTYVMTAQTFYNAPGCSADPLTETIVIAGDCMQLVFSGAVVGGTVSTRLTAQGSDIALTATCANFSRAGASASALTAARTYTATDTTFTLFTPASAAGDPNADRVEVFTRR